MTVDFGMQTTLFEEWLEENFQAEAGLNIPENWVPAIQLVSFNK